VLSEGVCLTEKLRLPFRLCFIRRMVKKWLLCTGVLLTTACAHRPLVRVPRGVVVTPHVEIRAEDGSFTYVSGQPFVSPRECIWGEGERSSSEIEATAKLVCHQGDAENRCLPRAEDYANALRAQPPGARRVRVTVPGLTEPLYGVLAFYCNWSGSAPAMQSLQIQVPQSYVDATSNGRISVVYEMFEIENGMGRLPTWALWLSRQPLP